MPNRQTWDIVFRTVHPSGSSLLFNATVKVYFEDDSKCMAYFDSNTLKWWDDMNEVELTEDEVGWYRAYKETIKRTLDHFTILPADVKAGLVRGHGCLTAFRKARTK